jgi:hypothetical protein
MSAGSEQIRDILEKVGRPEPDSEGSVLTDWVVVAGWYDAEGNHRLVRISDEDSMESRMKGLLFQVLFDEWERSDDG